MSAGCTPGSMPAAANGRRKKQGGRRRFVAWYALTPPTLVVPRECGGSSTPRLLGSIISATARSLRATGSRERAPDDRLREAIHRAAYAERWIPSSLSLLAMTAEIDSHSSTDMLSRSRGASRPSFALIFRAQKTEGAGKTGCALHPRSRVQLRKKNAHTSIQVQRRASGLPCAMVLRRTSCSPWCANSFSHHHPRIDGWSWPGRAATSSADLTPATGARTTRLGRTRHALARGLDGLGTHPPKSAGGA